MSNLVFVKTRWNYDSYADFWELVHLSGFPTCYVDEINLDAELMYIVAPMNGEWKQFLDGKNLKNRKARLLLWNLERPGGSGTLQQYTSDNQALIDGHYLDAVLVSDKDLASRTGFHFVPLGSHKKLNEYPQIVPTEKEFDLILLSCYSRRRSVLFEYPGVLKKRLLGMTVAPNAWGGERLYNLRHSKFMFNVHQDEFTYCEPLRFALAAAFKLPIISEYCFDTFPYHVVGKHRTVNELVEFAKMQINDYQSEIEYWTEVAGINYVCATTDFSFKKCLEKYL